MERARAPPHPAPPGRSAAARSSTRSTCSPLRTASPTDGATVAASSLTIRAGVTNAAAPSATDIQQDRAVQSVRVHRGYVDGDRTGGDDVAVLTLTIAARPERATANAIALPAPGDAARSSATRSTPRRLRAQGGRRHDRRHAERDERDDRRPDRVPAAAPYDTANAVLLCAFSGSSSPCGGDSGSALVLTAPTPVLVGVTRAASCTGNSTASFANMTAPEILEFVQGSDDPPAAPRPTSPPVLERPTPDDAGRPDRPLLARRLERKPELSYACYEGDHGAGAPRGLVARVHAARRRRRAERCFCRVIATNAGGTGFDESRADPARRAERARRGRPGDERTARRHGRRARAAPRLGASARPRRSLREARAEHRRQGVPHGDAGRRDAGAGVAERAGEALLAARACARARHRAGGRRTRRTPGRVPRRRLGSERPPAAGLWSGVMAEVAIRRDGPVLWITLNRPDRLNALDAPMHAGLARRARGGARPGRPGRRPHRRGSRLLRRAGPRRAPRGRTGVADRLREQLNRNVLAIRALEKPVIAVGQRPGRRRGALARPRLRRADRLRRRAASSPRSRHRARARRGRDLAGAAGCSAPAARSNGSRPAATSAPPRRCSGASSPRSSGRRTRAARGRGGAALRRDADARGVGDEAAARRGGDARRSRSSSRPRRGRRPSSWRRTTSPRASPRSSSSASRRSRARAPEPSTRSGSSSTTTSRRWRLTVLLRGAARDPAPDRRDAVALLAFLVTLVTWVADARPRPQRPRAARLGRPVPPLLHARPGVRLADRRPVPRLPRLARHLPGRPRDRAAGAPGRWKTLLPRRARDPGLRADVRPRRRARGGRGRSAGSPRSRSAACREECAT